MSVRLLVLSDTHLGFDLPMRPRVARPRRGEDFFAAFESALAPASRGEVDAVVHLGDLFFRSRISAALATRVFTRLAELADSGADVFWVPGNHERSGVPRGLLLDHPRIHVFDRPRTVVLRRHGLALALAGFPFTPSARADFRALLAATRHDELEADARLLCLHQAVEGARVGAQEFTFRDGAEVVRGADLADDAAGFLAVLCGHVHRAQVVERDLAGRPLPVPVIYPGSTERTSSAERDEVNGFLTLAVERRDSVGPAGLRWDFHPLASRPMIVLDVDPRRGGHALAVHLRSALAALAPRSIVRLRLAAPPSGEAIEVLRAASLRALAPAGMEVSVGWGRWSDNRTADPR